MTYICTFDLYNLSFISLSVHPQESQNKKNLAFPKNPDAWLKTAKEFKGSWWPVLIKWLQKHTDKAEGKIDSENFNKIRKKLEVEKAPGSYVRAD